MEVGNAYYQRLFLLQCRGIIMKNLMSKIKSFLRNQEGAETAEWAVIVGLLVIIGTTVYSPTGTIAAAISGVAAKITAGITAG